MMEVLEYRPEATGHCTVARVSALQSKTVPDEPNDEPVMTRFEPPLVGPLTLGVSDWIIGALYENANAALVWPDTVTNRALLTPLPAGTVQMICEPAVTPPTAVHVRPPIVTKPVVPNDVPVTVICTPPSELPDDGDTLVTVGAE